MKSSFSLSGKILLVFIMVVTIGVISVSSEKVLATDMPSDTVPIEAASNEDSSNVVPIGTIPNGDSRTVLIEEQTSVTEQIVSEPAITDSNVNNLDIDAPITTTPDEEVPDITLPDAPITDPNEDNLDVDIPDITVPDVTNPAVSEPAVSIPVVSGPGLIPEEDEPIKDMTPPEIVFSENVQDDSNNKSTDIEVAVIDSGKIITGIGQVHYSINKGEKIAIPLSDMELSEEKEQETIISQKGTFHIFLQELGKYIVTVWAEDEAGNAVEKDYTVTIEENPIISVIVPTTLDVIVDPYELCGKGQIYSEDFNIVNLSNVDIDLYVKSIECFIDDSNAEGVDKGYTLSLNKVSKTRMKDETLLQVTSQEKVVKGTESMKLRAADDTQEQKQRSIKEPNILTLNLSGSVTPESLDYWRNGDVKAYIEVTFKKSS